MELRSIRSRGLVRVGCEYPALPAYDGNAGRTAVVALAEREQVCWAALLRNQRAGQFPLCHMYCGLEN